MIAQGLPRAARRTLPRWLGLGPAEPRHAVVVGLVARPDTDPRVKTRTQEQPTGGGVAEAVIGAGPPAVRRGAKLILRGKLAPGGLLIGPSRGAAGP